MALPAIANFNVGDGALPTQVTTFSAVRGAMQVRSNAAQSNTGWNETCCRWNADTFNDDQYAFITATLLTASLFIGPAVRCSNSAETYYLYYWDNNDRYFAKMVNGTFTDLVTPQTGVTNNTGDVLRLEANGTTITAKVNGVQDGSFSTTDSSISSGYGGLCGWGQAFGSDTSGDTWEAGNLGGGAATLEQEGFRWRDDDGSETTATWLQAQDTDASVDKETPVRLRILINATNDPAAAHYKLQYKPPGTDTWEDVTT